VSDVTAMDLTTPALLFPAISLLLLAYTSRFLALANLTRSLHDEWRTTKSARAILQIKNLRARLSMIRSMQILGVVAFTLCTFSMLLLLVGETLLGQISFGASLLALLSSLLYSLAEISASNRALNIQLSELEGASPEDS
jgi:Protein of unknown function (DUF2721)